MDEIKLERQRHVAITSEQTKADIIKNSVQGLGNQPILSAAEMKKQFVKPVVNGDGKPSAIGEVDRVAMQAEAAIDEVLSIAYGAISAILSHVTKYDAAISVNSQSIENLRAVDTDIKASMTSLRQQLSKDIQTLSGTAAETSAKLAEVEALAKNAEVPIHYQTYAEMVADLNDASKTKYIKGNDINIVTLDVPDVWIFEIANTPVYYTYTTDDAIVAALNAGRFQVGYYVLSPREGHKAFLKDYKTKEGHKADVQALLSLFPTIER